MMHRKTIWKPEVSEIAKAFADSASRGVYSAPYKPPVARGHHADTRWV